MTRPPPLLRGHTNYKRNRQAIPWGVPLTLLTQAYQQTLYQCSERVGVSSMAVCVRQRAELGGLLVWICTVKGMEFSHLSSAPALPALNPPPLPGSCQLTISSGGTDAGSRRGWIRLRNWTVGECHMQDRHREAELHTAEWRGCIPRSLIPGASTPELICASQDHSLEWSQDGPQLC